MSCLWTWRYKRGIFLMGVYVDIYHLLSDSTEIVFLVIKKHWHTLCKLQLEIRRDKKLSPKSVWQTDMKWTVVYFQDFWKRSVKVVEMKNIPWDQWRKNIHSDQITFQTVSLNSDIFLLRYLKIVTLIRSFKTLPFLDLWGPHGPHFSFVKYSLILFELYRSSCLHDF